MTNQQAPAARPANRTRTTLTITAVILAVLVIIFFVFAGLYTDVLWFDQLGFLNVLTTQWVSQRDHVRHRLPRAWPCRCALSIEIAYRARPVYAKLNSQLDRYQQVVEPLRRLAMFGIPVVLGIFGGVSAAARWPRRAAVPQQDPVRHDRPAVRPRPLVLLLRPAVLARRRRLRRVGARHRRHSPRSRPATCTAPSGSSGARCASRARRASSSRSRPRSASRCRRCSIWLDQYATLYSEAQGFLAPVPDTPT